MGKNPDPSWEELELIFAGFSNNEDEATILEHIQETMSYSRNRRFIRQRRLHWEVAKKVLQTKLEQEIDPVIVEQRKKHFERLADIARALLSNEIDSVQVAPSGEGQPYEYVYCGVGTTREALSVNLETNVDYACHKFSEYDVYASFVPHFNAEHSQCQSKEFFKAIEENPYKLIESLRILARRGTFKGTCPVCKDWV